MAKARSHLDGDAVLWEFISDASVHRLFEARVQAFPENTAIVSAAERTSYAELNRAANRLAHYLRRRGVCEGDRVALLLGRSSELVTAQLGILKCGAAYVPLDSAAPMDRRRFLIQDCDARFVLATRDDLVLDVADNARIDIDSLSLEDEPDCNLPVELQGDAAACVMYTSGSTGLPKGVVVPHRAVARLIIDNGYAEFGPSDHVAFAGNPAFDVATLEVWAALLAGGSIVIVDRSTLLWPRRLCELLCREHVTVLFLASGLFAQYADELAEAFAQLRLLIIGGDVLDVGAVRRTLSTGRPRHIFNAYGPTELTSATIYEILEVPTDAVRFPIGRATNNCYVYILDEDMRPTAEGVTGELYLGGPGLALEYLKRPELTQAGFVHNPFIEGERLYKTGDLAYRRHDGNIEFIGRADFQVKVRGFRVDLGEVESTIGTFNGIGEAIVIARANAANEKHLIAYFTSLSDEAVALDALRLHLESKLPSYMVPVAYIALDELPLTLNGKVDRGSLPLPNGDSFVVAPYTSPTGDTEASIAAVWSDLLGVERVGRDDNFFELGGHSLLAVRMIQRLRNIGLGASVTTVFAAPTVAALALAIDDNVQRSVRPTYEIPAECTTIGPEMLPLVDLTPAQIEMIAAGVPGGMGNIADIYPLASLQEGIFFHHLLVPDGDPYLLRDLYRFPDRAQLDQFIEALQSVADRHDMLRTSLSWEGLAEPVQVVWRQANVIVEEVATKGDVAEALLAHYDPRSYRLNLREAPLLRVGIAREDDGRWLMVLAMHHLVSDHAAIDLLHREIGEILAGRRAQLPASTPFRDFVAQTRLGVSRAEHEAFFTDLLSGVEDPTVPFGLSDVHGDGSRNRESHEALSAELGQRLRTRARILGVSPASIFHLAWARVLSVASARDDVVFGTVLFGRMHGSEGGADSLGLFINTLPVRLRIAARSVLESVRDTHSALAKLLRHEHAPLSVVQRAAPVTPLFSALINYVHYVEDTSALPSGVEHLRSSEYTNYPLTLTIKDFGERFEVITRVDTDLEPKRICGYMLAALEGIVNALQSEPHRRVQDIDVLPIEEREELLVDWNRFTNHDELVPSVVALFEQQVALTPNAIAITANGEMTYAQLNADANSLAGYLLAHGVERGDRIAVCLERGSNLPIAMLATLKSGGVYVPIDPGYPAERLRFLLEDSSPRAVVTDSRVPDGVNELLRRVGAITIDLDRDAELWHAEAANNGIRDDLSESDLAYLIYTSGTTGVPKGVMVERGHLAQKLAAVRDSLGFTAEDSLSNLASHAFDISLLELLLPLITGGRAVPLKSAQVSNVEELVALTGDVTFFHAVPSLMETWLTFLGPHAQSRYARLRCILVGGEAVTRQLLQRLQTTFPDADIVELYGPTEATMVSAQYRVDLNSLHMVPHCIGRPFGRTRLYVLDAALSPLPVGVEGELYIGGSSVARGYWNRPDQTAERFVASPFVQNDRLYRTGDVVRVLRDGNMQFLGRDDTQVKIRGFRIELGEIEEQLVRHAGVRRALATAREDNAGQKQLVAYYTAEPDADVSAGTLRAYLLTVLPDYMVPSAYVALEAIPLTVHGKVDRDALPLPDGSARVARPYAAPIGPVEEQIADIWKELLGVEVGRDDNFFELGGHSLLAVAVIELMRNAGLVADVSYFVETATLAELAASVGSSGVSLKIPANIIPDDASRITPEMLPLVSLTQVDIDRIAASVPGGVANIADIYPLAPLQEGILFHHLLVRESDPYLTRLTYRFTTREHVNQFIEAMQTVVDRHDILRTAIFWEGLPESVQVVYRRAPLVAREVEVDSSAGDIAEQLASIFDPWKYRLNLQEAPLLRLGFAEETDGRWLMVVLLHHLIADHTALEIMNREIALFMAGGFEELPPPLPFRNFVAQTRFGVSREEHEAFFGAMLGDVDEPTAPYGLINVHGDGSQIVEGHRALDAVITQRLRSQARALGVSTASICHLAWACVLGAISGRHDVVFGTVLSGRMSSGEGSDQVLGPFINTLPVRLRLGAASVEQAIRDAHAVLAELLRHEHASLSLAQRCSLVAAPSPLFTAIFNYVNVAPFLGNSASLGADFVEGEALTNYPITFSVADFGNDLGLYAQTDVSLDPQRICVYMHTALCEIVSALEQRPLSSIADVSVLPSNERDQLLYTWNDTGAEYSIDRCFHEIFEEQARRCPDSVAVVNGEHRTTYKELNARANQLALYLCENGVRRGARVVVCFKRSVEMLVAILGVLKAGAAYVPLDPNYPSVRLQFMLADCEASAILTHECVSSEVRSTFSDSGIATISVGVQDRPWTTYPERDLRLSDIEASDLAYVIYTSGSTGMPKGVMIEHRGLTNYLKWAAFHYACESPSIVSSSLSFDATITSLFLPLITGSSVLLLEEGNEPEALSHLLSEAGDFGILKITPSHLDAIGQRFVEKPPAASVATIVVGGEQFHAKTAAIWRKIQPKATIINEYGPTEAVVGCTAYEVAQAPLRGPVLIGRPISNARVYILDDQLQPVPTGVAGELYIGGPGVARGYWNRPELTAERFIASPFVDGDRLYRTGDVARRLGDGNIEYLGRNDDQVKIRGFRIELGEIESRLREHPGVQEAAVVVREAEIGDASLIAYYTNVANVPVDDLRQHLANALPEYMVPGILAPLEALPRTPNGKLDRSALPSPAEIHAPLAFEAPIGDLEIAIAEVWRELFKLERVGRSDNFFELGGHSLLAIRLLSRLRSTMNVELSLSELFASPTLVEFASAVQRNSKSDLPPIVPTVRAELMPLSFAQQRLWLLAQMPDVSQTYHIPLSMRLRGALDRAALQHTIETIVSRHETLRTTFEVIDGEPRQRIHPIRRACQLQVDDLTWTRNKTLREAELSSDEAMRAFDLFAGPLIRCRLIILGPEDHVLLVTMHHIVADGWSLPVWAREFSEIYRARVDGRNPSLPPLPIQYVDYAVWQQNRFADESMHEQIEYWEGQLSGAPSVLEIPTDRRRPNRQSFVGSRVGVEIDEQLTEALVDLSRRHGTTLFMTLFGAWATLLSRLSGQEDVVVGTVTANRMCDEVQPLIGFFVNTLAIRLSCSKDITVSDMLEHTKAKMLGAQRNEDLPFEQVVDIVKPSRSLAHSPVFQHVFAWQSNERVEFDVPGLDVSIAMPEYPVAKFDLTLSLSEREGRIVGALGYPTALFDRATIDSHLAAFRQLLLSMTEDAAQPIGDLALVSPEERRALLARWSDKRIDYPRDRCIHQIFEERVCEKPDAVAIVHEGSTVSYAQLNTRANYLADILIRNGVARGARVAICMGRGPDMIAGLLSVLKAGAAYVPLDPLLPSLRLMEILNDAVPALTIVDSATAPSISALPLQIPFLELDTLAVSALSVTTAFESDVAPSDLAYIMYTSGSTGTPKGSMIEHSNVVSFVTTSQYLDLSSQRGMLQHATITFDSSTLEIWGALLSGARCIISSERVLTPEALKHLVSEAGVDATFLTAPLFNALVDDDVDCLTGMRDVMVGGDTLSSVHIRRAQRAHPAVRFLNGYGPTECTVFAMCHPIEPSVGDDEEPIGLGSPVGNTRVYVLDGRLEPVPLAGVGEIYIGGDGVGRGYWQRPELTSERFLASPFVEGETLYRSGDLARPRADGTLQFLGRNDFQVKIRGMRVELGEIETHLRSHSAIAEAIVVTREDASGEKQLLGYFTRRSGMRADREELQAHLASTLPEYMIPAALVELEALPLNLNGKIDRGLLPSPALTGLSGTTFECPRDGIETAIADIWRELLKIEQIGRNDSFFELGGHSLLAVRVLSRLRLLMDVEASLSDMFACPRLRDFAAAVDKSAKRPLSVIRAVDRHSTLPLSFAQQRLWFLAQIGASEGYHVPFGLRLRGSLNVALLKRSLDEIIARHEALRTTFNDANGEPAQVISETFRVVPVYYDLSGCRDSEQLLTALAQEDAAAPFDLRTGPLIRCTLIRVRDDEHVLLITMHHIISDGWSMSLFLRELGALYTAHVENVPDPLPALSLQYVDYASWEREQREYWTAEHEGYWHDALQGAEGLLALPTDRPRPAKIMYAGAHVPLDINAELADSLKRVCLARGITLHMALLAAWVALMARLSGQQDVVVGVPVANRSHPQIEALIGFFVNTLPIRVECAGDTTVAELLGRVKASMIAAQEHQGVPFERIVEIVNPPRSTAYTPIFQTAFAWQNNESAKAVFRGIEHERLTSEYPFAKFDLMLNLTEADEQISGSIEFATSLFDQDTVARWADYLLAVIVAISKGDETPILGIPLLSVEERQNIVVAWNATKRAYPAESSVQRLFEEQAEATPDHTAITDHHTSISYAELNLRANQMAQYLAGTGVRIGDRVAIRMERSIDLIVSELAVLKRGAILVPLDENDPKIRIEEILRDSGARVVLTKNTSADLNVDGVRRVDVDTLCFDRFYKGNVDHQIDSSRAAYVLYTSGSTGEPKGVVVSHRAIARLAINNGYAELTPFDRVAFASSPAFDASTFEIWAALLNGAMIVVVDQNCLLDPASFAGYIKAQGVTALWLTSSLFTQCAQLLSPVLPSLKYLIIGGDVLDIETIADVLQNCAPEHLLNGYGPTEATTFSTTHEIRSVEDHCESIPIGRPIGNTRCYILDELMEPVPPGVVGELYIGGAGVAIGYWNRPELTRERFVASPFDPKDRLYKTGDMARYRRDGTIIFLGRKDFQVKIRGFRIEPGEVETALRRYPAVNDAVVVARNYGLGEKRLVAYVATDVEIDDGTLRRYLQGVLPSYMLPAAFVALRALPLTKNGKVDRNGLPEPADASFAQKYAEPVGSLEREIARIWSEVLNVERVGRHDNFFELGGHSLLAVRVLSLMRRQGMVSDALTLFASPTVAQLAEGTKEVEEVRL